MELIALWRTLIKRWKMVVIITLVATLTAGVLSKFVLPKQYAGVTTLMVVPQGSAGLYSGLVSGQQLTTTYAALATSATILGQVIHQLHLGIPLTTLAGMVKAKPGAILLANDN
ncbi:MAG: Wzz/FepE/Etk N-terminal domain-containing protein [Thermaerobacter sp.]|nr:Wzz/FepE/Etk N-terminal domain-containing protein [Thermaerobacter sp.]